MANKAPSLQEWRNLYEAMQRIKETAPWQWLHEQDIFVVENPESKELGFVSVMGAIGEHYSIAVYLGEEALAQFWEFQETEPDMFAFQKLFEMPHLQASFEDREFLYDEDREIIKKLSLSFRGKAAWPLFRSYKPGFFPWFLSAEEARFLTHVLEQTVDVSLRAQKDPSTLLPEEGAYLLRKSIKKGDALDWQDETWEEYFFDYADIEPQVDEFVLQKLADAPKKYLTLEFDMFMLPQPAREGDEKPYYPYLLLLIDANSGLIVNQEAIPPLPDLKSMQAQLASHVAQLLLNSSTSTSRIHVDSDLFLELLAPLKDVAGITIEHVLELKEAPQARISFMEFMEKFE